LHDIEVLDLALQVRAVNMIINTFTAEKESKEPTLVKENELF
jgi:hypothetical protein